MSFSAHDFYDEWKEKNAKEKAYMVAGAFFLLLALVGVALPIVPQIPFAVISAALFSKGSEKFHQWVRENKFFGEPVRDWEDHRAVKPKVKAISTVMMLAGAGIGHYKFDLPWALALDGVFLICIIFVLTRKNAGKEEQRQEK